MNKLSEVQKDKIVKGLFITGAAATLYFIYKKLTAPKKVQTQDEITNDYNCIQEENIENKQQQQQVQQVEQVEEIKEQKVQKVGLSTEEQLDQIVQNMKMTYAEADILDLRSLELLMAASATLSVNEFQEFTIENRKKRRSFKQSQSDDYDKYIELCMEYTEEMQSVMVKYQQMITDRLNISESQLENCMQYHMQRGRTREIYMLGAQQSVKLKDKMAVQKDLDLEQSLAAFKFQLDFIQNNPDFIMRISDCLFKNAASEQEQYMLMQQIPAIMNLVISDELYEMYQIEEEDLVAFLRKDNNLQNPQLQQLMGQLQMAIQQIMYQMGGGQQGFF